MMPPSPTSCRSASPSSAPAPSATITTCRASGSTRAPSWSPPAMPTPSCSNSARRDWGIDKVTTDPEAICADPDVDAVIIATPNFTHRPIAAGGRPRRQARDVREAAGAERRRSARDVPRGPRRRRGAHDGLHLSLRPVDALPQAPGHQRRAGRAAALSQPAVPRLARDELGLAAVQAPGRRRRPVRHDDPPHRLRASTCWGRSPGSAARGPLRSAHADGRRPDRASRRTSTTGRASSASSPAARPASGKARRWPRATAATASATSGPRSTAPKARPSISCTSRTRSCWARRARTWPPVAVPAEFLKPADSPRDPADGEPATVFRYDLVWEFVSAIVEGRPAVPELSTTACKPRSWPTR